MMDSIPARLGSLTIELSRARLYESGLRSVKRLAAVHEGVKKWGLTPLAQQDLNEHNGLPSRGRGQTPFLHTFMDRRCSTRSLNSFS